MRQRAKSFESVSDGSGESSVKLSVNVSGDIGQRLRRIAFEERLSESSIVQIAFLKEQGASLRRGVRS
jgi:hypothetical protein